MLDAYPHKQAHTRKHWAVGHVDFNWPPNTQEDAEEQ